MSQDVFGLPPQQGHPLGHLSEHVKVSTKASSWVLGRNGQARSRHLLQRAQPSCVLPLGTASSLLDGTACLDVV